MVFGLIATTASVIGLCLLFKFGFGISLGGDSTNIVDSPDQSEKTIDSNNEHLENSEEISSHNSTSYHVTVGSGIIIMILVIIIGGLVTYLKL